MGRRLLLKYKNNLMFTTNRTEVYMRGEEELSPLLHVWR